MRTVTTLLSLLALLLLAAPQVVMAESCDGGCASAKGATSSCKSGGCGGGDCECQGGDCGCAGDCGCMECDCGVTLGLATMQKLDLDEGQVSKILGLRQEMAKQHADLHADIRQARWKLAGLKEQDRPKPAAIGEQYGKIFQARQQMIEDRWETRNRILGVLTEEQRNKLEEMECSGGTCPLPKEKGKAAKH